MYLGNLTTENLEKIIDEMVSKAIDKHLKEIRNEQKDENWLTVEAGCKKLGISRQTWNNWKKNKDFGSVMKNNCMKLGGKALINVEGVRRYMKEVSIYNSKYQGKMGQGKM